MNQEFTAPSRKLLAERLAGLHRCGYFLGCSSKKIDWPLSGEFLKSRNKDLSMFECLSAINERFAKLQDILGSAMRQSMILSGAPEESFLRILAFYEKQGVIASVDDWIACRALRNLATHEYATDYDRIAQHFNELRHFIPGLLQGSARFIDYCASELGATPDDETFSEEFTEVLHAFQE